MTERRYLSPEAFEVLCAWIEECVELNAAENPETVKPCGCTKYAGKPPCIHDYARTVAELVADIDAVRELHQVDGDGYCNHCASQAYPCLTIQSLDGEQE